MKAVHAPRQQLNNCRQRPTSQTSKGILAPVEQRAPLFVTRNKRHHARSFRIKIRTSAYMARHFAVHKDSNVVYVHWTLLYLQMIVLKRLVDEFERCSCIRVCLSRFSLFNPDPLYTSKSDLV